MLYWISVYTLASQHDMSKKLTVAAAMSHEQQPKTEVGSQSGVCMRLTLLTKVNTKKSALTESQVHTS